MDLLKQHKILYSLVSSVLAVSLVVYCFGYYSVQAADVSTLPADIDITVTYDADSINWTYDGTDYSFLRDFPLVLSHGESQLFYNATNYRYLYDYKGSSSVFPLTVEADSSFVLCRASYWFSPSENALYIIRDDDRFSSSYYSAVRSYGVSNGHGSFYMVGGSKSVDFCVLRYDFNDRTFIYGGDKYLYGNHTFNSFKYYDFNSGIALKDSANHDTYMSVDDTELTCYIPSDLLCIFSNYEISGFYEPDTSKVNTPDYYFNYQYIFYLDGKGYTFVDSAQPLTEVTAQGSYAYLTFTDSCNKYIYTSIDGITWDIKTTVDTMYGGTFTKLAYDWLYSKTTVGAVNQYDAELVYTNDDKFGKPVVVWDDINDLEYVINKLPELSKGYLEKEQNGVYNEIIKDTGIVSGISKFLEGFSSSVGSDLGIGNAVSWIYSLFGRDIYTVSDLTLMQIAQDLISNTNWRYSFTDDSGAEHYVSYTTLRGYIYEIDAVLTTLNRNFDYYRDDMDFYFKNLNSSFATLNINLGKFFDSSNTHLSALTDKLGKLPDYSAALKDISGKLDKLDSLAPVPFDDFALLSSIGSFSSSVDTHFQSIQNQLDNLFGLQNTKLDAVLSAMPSGSGSVSVDLTELTKSVTDMSATLDKQLKDGFDDIHGDLKYIKTLLTVNTIDNLFDDDGDDSKNVGTFVSNGISSLASGSVISGALAFSPAIIGGIQAVNGVLGDLYTSVPALIPVFTVGPSFYIIDLILRRKK